MEQYEHMHGAGVGKHEEWQGMTVTGVYCTSIGRVMMSHRLAFLIPMQGFCLLDKWSCAEIGSWKDFYVDVMSGEQYCLTNEFRCNPLTLSFLHYSMILIGIDPLTPTPPHAAPNPLGFLDQHGMLQSISQSSQWCGIVQETDIHVVLSTCPDFESLSAISCASHCNREQIYRICTMATNDTKSGHDSAKYQC